MCRTFRLKTTRSSTAYLNFKSPADVLAFKSAFDGAPFSDERGGQHPAAVEYAPFQRVPKQRVKRDPREGTIENGAPYSIRAYMHACHRQQCVCWAA